MTADPVRVVVVDDHRIVREGLVALLDALEGIEVVGSAVDGREALAVIGEHAPDVVVMDIQMPGLDGIEATARVRAAQPRTRVLMLTMTEDEETILSAVRAGACGYLLKGADALEVTRAIATAASGGMVFGAALSDRLGGVLSRRPPAVAATFPGLTDRELEILDLMAAGRSNQAIAAHLYLSPKTVRNLVSSVYAKLPAADRAEAMIKAREAGMGRSG